MDLTALMTQFTNICIQGAVKVQPYALGLLGILATIELALLSALNMLGEGENPIYFITKKLLKYGFFYFLIENWVTEMALTQELFKMFKMMGGIAAGSNTEFLAKDIGEKGVIMAASIFENIYKLGIGNLGSIIINVILGIIIFLCFVVIAVYMFVTEVQFYLVATLTIILLPFGVNKFTSFLSEKVIGAIFSLGIKIMTLNFVLCLTWNSLIGIAPVKPEGTNIGEVLGILLVGVAMMYLTLSAPTLASDLLSGSPTMGDNSARGMANAAKSAGGMAKGAVTGAMGGYGMVQAAANADGGRTPGGKISASGTARNLGSILRQQMPDRQAQSRGEWLHGQSKGIKKAQQKNEDNIRQGNLFYK